MQNPNAHPITIAASIHGMARLLPRLSALRRAWTVTAGQRGRRMLNHGPEAVKRAGGTVQN
jgi:hypothetical protein